MSAHVITVAQQKGGSGKTTLAIHLAVAFAKKGLSTMVFDTDPQGTLSHWHAQRKAGDIGLIATSGWRLTRDLAMAREANDIIIIDTPPHAEMDIKVSTRAADMVVVPLQPSPADLWAVKETMNTVAAESCHSMVVLNRVVPRAMITNEIKKKLALLDIPVAKASLGNRVLFASSMEVGETVLDQPSNPAVYELNNLVREISSILGISAGLQEQKRSKAKPVAKAEVAAKMESEAAGAEAKVKAKSAKSSSKPKLKAVKTEAKKTASSTKSKPTKTKAKTSTTKAKATAKKKTAKKVS